MSGAGNGHFHDLQTTANDVRKAERLTFLPEMQSKVTSNCDNCSGTEYETWGFGWVVFLCVFVVLRMYPGVHS